eukprot:COSAG05_NODE_1244_length_5415_cov_4.418736_3_plen_441_part_00
MGQQHIAILDNLVGGARKKRWGPAKEKRKSRFGKTKAERDAEQVGFVRPHIIKAQEAVNEAMNERPEIQAAARALLARETAKARAQKAVNRQAETQKAARDALKRNKQKRASVGQRAVDARFGTTPEEQMKGPSLRAADRISRIRSALNDEPQSVKGFDRFAKRIAARAAADAKPKKEPRVSNIDNKPRTAKTTSLEPKRAAAAAKKQKEKRADVLAKKKKPTNPFVVPNYEGPPVFAKLSDDQIAANVQKYLSGPKSKPDGKDRAVKPKLEPGKRGDTLGALRKKNRAAAQNRKRVTKTASGEHVHEPTTMDEDDIEVTDVVTAADRTAAARAAAKELSDDDSDIADLQESDDEPQGPIPEPFVKSEPAGVKPEPFRLLGPGSTVTHTFGQRPPFANSAETAIDLDDQPAIKTETPETSMSFSDITPLWWGAPGSLPST